MQDYSKGIDEQFLPGERDLHLTWANNHTAIFMQGLWTCGQVFDRPEWTRIAGEFAERFYESGHPDGYWEENTNARREGGPSLVYTRLTAGCLFDVLDGRDHPRDKFVRAGDFYRGFLNDDNEIIPLADERTNSSGRRLLAGEDALEAARARQLATEDLRLGRPPRRPRTGR